MYVSREYSGQRYHDICFLKTKDERGDPCAVTGRGVEGVGWVERVMCRLPSAPVEGHVPRSISALLHQRFVELAAGA